MPVNTRLQVRRGTSSSWTSTNPILYAGEIGYETDSSRFKIGDGTTSWSSLDYAAVVPTGFIAGSGIGISVAADGSTVTISSNNPTVEPEDISGLTEYIQDIIGLSGLASGSGISVSYNDSTGLTTISLSDPTIQLSDITDLSSNARTFLGTPTSANFATLVTDETGSGSVVFSSGATLTNATLAGSVTIGSDSLSEVIEDTIGSKVKGSSNIVVSYNDTNGETTISASGLSTIGHTHILTDITDVSASATEVNYLDGSIPGTGVAGKAVVLDSNRSIFELGTVSTTGDLTVGRNLIVNGTTTTVNSTTVTIDDPIFTLGGDTAPGSDDNKDRGIEFRYHNGTSAKLGFFGYDDSTGKFTFIPDASNTSEVFSGTKGEVDANIDWSNILNKPDPIVSVNLTGDVTGSGNATLTDLANGNINISTTIAANSIGLGVDTTGNYVASITNGSYITGADGGSEGANLTLAVDAATTNTGSKIVARDANGNFAAGIVTASGLTGVSSANPVIITYAVIDGGSP